MTFAQDIRRSSGIAMLALFPLAAHGEPSAVQEGCGSAFANLTPARLEQLLRQPLTGPSRCYEDKLGSQAVTLLSRIRNQDRSLRAARFKEIEDLLAATAPGIAKTRLEILRNVYRPS